MAEYLAPGVYVEEIPVGPRPIAGVGTSTAGFVGLGRSEASRALGPFGDLADYERQTSAKSDADWPRPDFLWHAVRAFFAEGGKRLWIATVSQEALSNEGAPRAFERSLDAITSVDEVAIIAAPGATNVGPRCSEQDAVAIWSMLLARATPKRFALLDPLSGQSPEQVRGLRPRSASSYGALYYPWLKMASARDDAQFLPPSPFVAGAYARSDAERGVWKAPDNEMLRSVTGLEREVDGAELQRLNEDGINVVRKCAHQGIRLWGSRTLASGGEYKYVNVRRYITYIQTSIAAGIEWMVSEPNTAMLGALLRRSIEEFLHAEWRRGALAGDCAQDAYFVRCDRSTMTQDDLDNGHVVVLVGVAILHAAEFVVFRIGIETQKPPD